MLIQNNVMYFDDFFCVEMRQQMVENFNIQTDQV
jgi:hypothetical protein